MTAELEAERYAADLKAIAECIAHKISYESVAQLAFECGIDSKTVAQMYRKQLEAA